MITSLQKVRTRIPLTELEVQWDTLLVNMISATLDRFNLETARLLQRTVNHIEHFDAATTNLSLQCYPIETIAKWELLEDGEWKEQFNVSCAIRQGGIVALQFPIGLSGQIARVTYTGGYVLPDPVGSPGQFPLPGILETAAIETVTFWFQSKDAVGLRQIETINGDYREFADAEWVPWVRSTLSHYRRLTIRPP